MKQVIASWGSFLVLALPLPLNHSFLISLLRRTEVFFCRCDKRECRSGGVTSFFMTKHSRSSLRSENLEIKSLKAHRDKQIAEGGDDSRAETNDQRTIRSDHELSCRSHGYTSCQGGVLDMHLSGQLKKKNSEKKKSLRGGAT